MGQRTYAVRCECGNEGRVSAADAGTSWACGCGRAVEVPSLARLKAAAGEAAASADLQIEHLLRTRQLPFETDCVACGRRTAHTFAVTAVCERQEVDEGGLRWYHAALFPVFGVWAIIAGLRRRGYERGRDVRFRLPVRLCEGCTEGLDSWDKVRAALRRTPVYADLLDKYPHTKLSK